MDSDSHGIIMYGTSWCPDCNLVKDILARFQIQYEFINIENNPAAVKNLALINNGSQTVPTIVFPNGAYLVKPTSTQLESKLTEVI